MIERQKTVRIKPFEVPDRVQIQVVDSYTDQYMMLCYLDAETLSELCDEFRSSLFERRGLQDPKLADKQKIDGVFETINQSINALRDEIK